MTTMTTITISPTGLAAPALVRGLFLAIIHGTMVLPLAGRASDHTKIWKSSFKSRNARMPSVRRF